jgi:hypothetical protein
VNKNNGAIELCRCLSHHELAEFSRALAARYETAHTRAVTMAGTYWRPAGHHADNERDTIARLQASRPPSL